MNMKINKLQNHPNNSDFATPKRGSRAFR